MALLPSFSLLRSSHPGGGSGRRGDRGVAAASSVAVIARHAAPLPRTPDAPPGTGTASLPALPPPAAVDLVATSLGAFPGHGRGALTARSRLKQAQARQRSRPRGTSDRG